VRTWVKKVVEAGHSRGLHFSPSALGYYSRQFFEINSPEQKTVIDHLGAIFEDQRTGATWVTSKENNTDIDIEPEEEDDYDFELAPIKLKPVDPSTVKEDVFDDF
jgi:hypothetical protein